MLPEKLFYMIRHGQTEANASHIMAGQMNSPLTETGRKQADVAREVVEKLKIKPALIVHSHLDRARDTALTINRNLDIPAIEEKDIAEIFVGDWEGTPYESSLDLYLQGMDPPNGESHQSFRSRVADCVRRYCKKHNGPILFVCHGGVMRAIAGLYGINSDRFQNCHLHEFEPVNEKTSLPWQVWQHDILECGNVKRSLSPLFHEVEDDQLLTATIGNRPKYV